jgi:biopolymer transport protein ExbD
MPKIKMPSRSPSIDMTPMVDLFSLLLTFFMLTSTFRQSEVAEVKTPSSVSEKQAPDNNILTLYIDSVNRVYFNIDNGKDTSTHFRADIIKEMGVQFNVQFTDKQVLEFQKGASFGMPMKDISKYLDPEEDKDMKKNLQIGIPIDSIENRPSELWYWVRVSRMKNPECEVEIKGDAAASYKIVRKVLDIMQANKVNKFNLTTVPVKEVAVLED